MKTHLIDLDNLNIFKYFIMEKFSNITTIEIGGIEFLLNNLEDYLPYTILTSLGTIVGIIG